MKTDHPSPESYAHAAWMIDCEPAAIQAVAEVEAGTQGAFLTLAETGEEIPTILFEPHIFGRLTEHKYDGRTVMKGLEGPQWVISRKKWEPGTYGTQFAQHTKLAAASALDRPSALMSASWGLFQILGVNYRRAGFASIQDLVNAAYRDVDAHLRMFVRFIMGDPILTEALQRKAWTMFAKRYNGSGYAANRYDEKMRDAYLRIVGQA